MVYAYCYKCNSKINSPTAFEIQQGYVECENCNKKWDDFNNFELLCTMVEELQDKMEELQGEIDKLKKKEEK